MKLSLLDWIIIYTLIFMVGVVALMPQAKARKLNREIRVMVIDTGIGMHEDLVGHVRFSEKDSIGHGTHVAGIIIYGNEHLGDTPLCPEVKLYSCKYYNTQDDVLAFSKSVECLEKANAMHMDYVNYSGGGSDTSLQEYYAVSEYVNSGGIIVAAAGNNGQDLRYVSYYPASYGLGPNKLKNIIVVQNLRKDGTVASTSNTHPEAVSARGEHIFSTLPNNTYGYESGTSMAAPQVLHEILKKKCQELQ